MTLEAADSIPTKALLKMGDDRLRGILERPLMYGGNWEGVEHALVDAMALREIALYWPAEPPEHLGMRWCKACNLVYPETRNTCMFYSLKREGVEESEFPGYMKLAVDKFLELEALKWPAKKAT